MLCSCDKYLASVKWQVIYLSTLPERKCILSNTFSKTFIHHNKLYHKNAAYTSTNIKYTEYFLVSIYSLKKYFLFNFFTKYTRKIRVRIKLLRLRKYSVHSILLLSC